MPESSKIDIDQYIIRRSDYIELLLPVELHYRMMDALYDDGWKILRHGPMPKKDGDLSASRQYFIAVREKQ